MTRKAKGLSLLSGGLDSQLAVKVLQDAGAYVEGVVFETPFFSVQESRKAASALGVKGIHVRLVKRIPSCAGMGGGSADAAAVLRGLNRLYGAGLSTATLASLGTPLGADIPFCVYGGKARCKGIGEQITVLEKDFLHLVIIKPGANCPTGKMYGVLDEINREIPEYDEGVYFNSFDAVCPQECKDAMAFLSASGASVSMLSGSGSAVFGVFDTESAARNAAEKAKSVYPFAVYAYTI
jgi:4-diphosphocytidyl-2-C-methyl-D-erythritol kinase